MDAEACAAAVKMRRRAALSILLSGCRRSQQGRIHLGIAAQQSVSQVPVYLAGQLDLYRKNGIDVELHEFAGASKGMEALLGGSVDVLSGYYTQVLAVLKQGRQIDSFLCYYDSLLVALAVAPGSKARIQRIEDLRGTKVGVTTLGSATHQFLDFLMRRHGLSASDVTPIAIGTASRAAAAMERGLVDAGVVTDFTIRYLERRFGSVVLLADTRSRSGVREAHGVDAFPGTVLMAPHQWLQRNPEQSKKLAAAVWQAVEWMKAHTAEEIVRRMPASHYGEDREAYVAAIRSAIPLLSRTGQIDAKSEAAAREFLP